MDVLPSNRASESLDDEVARTRADRLKRTGTTSNPAQDDDARDNASIRDNIKALASRGQAGGSLAAFMGTSGAVRLGKVNTDMTEDEQESTSKLEQEMAAARSKWKSTDERAVPTGPSLASIMTSRTKEQDDQVREQVITRFARPVKAATVPLVGAQANEASANRPKSLAELMGSKATGPRLNKPAPQPEIERTEATMAHAGSTPFALPGMARRQEPTRGNSAPEQSSDPIVPAVSRTIPTKPFNSSSPPQEPVVPAVSPTFPTKPFTAMPSAAKTDNVAKEAFSAKPAETRTTNHRSQPSISQEMPQSPKKSVRDAISAWGTPKKDSDADQRALQIKASYGVKVGSISSPPRTFRGDSGSSSLSASPTKSVSAASTSPVKTAKSVQDSTPSKDSLLYDITDGSRAVPADVKDGLRSDRVYLINAKPAFVWRGRRSASSDTKSAYSSILGLGSKVVEVDQGHESDELLRALNGKLITRLPQAGSSIAEEAMYTIRTRSNGLLCDEVEKTPHGLCSAYCSVLALLTEIFVWNGRHASSQDRRAAAQFASDLMNGGKPTVLEEGKESDYFVHALGGQLDYASANHWRFMSMTDYDPSVFTFEHGSLSHQGLSRDRVSLIDATFEHFVIIPSNDLARSSKEDIEAALNASRGLAEKWRARKLPFRPPVHALVFPTVVPRDLRHVMRDLDFDQLNGQEKPTKMQLFTEEELQEQFLQK